MSTKLPGTNPTAYLGVKETDPPQLYFRTRSPTAADARPYDAGDVWIDQTADEAWVLIKRIGAVATWVGIGGVGAIETITGDSGGAVSPDGAENFNFLGNTAGFLNGIQFTGTPASNTMTAKDLRNVTVYVVDATAGETEYTTVQAAINAANADGGGEVYVRPGTFVEDLTLYDDIIVRGAGLETIIQGTHTPPAAGDVTFHNLTLNSATDIFATADAVTSRLMLFNVLTQVTNGFTFDMPNATGTVVMNTCAEESTNNGFINNTGGMTVSLWSSIVGAGTGQTYVMDDCTVTAIGSRIVCPGQFGGTTAAWLSQGCALLGTMTITDDADISIFNSAFSSGATTCIDIDSTVACVLSDVTLETSNPTVIDGTGEIVFGSVTFVNEIGVAAGITRSVSSRFWTGTIDCAQVDIDPQADADSYVLFAKQEVDFYSFGIDADDSDKLTITDGSSPSAGNVIYEYVPGATPGQYWYNTAENQIHYENSGGLVRHFLRNSSTDASSFTTYECRQEGDGAGDAAFCWTIGDGAGGVTQEFGMGIDNSATGNPLVINNSGTAGTGVSGGTQHWFLTTAGERTMPNQPAFCATVNANQNNVTGAGTTHTVNFQAERFDQNADYDGTNTFTASVTGRYFFEATVPIDNADALATVSDIAIVTSNNTYKGLRTNGANARCGASNSFTLIASIVCDMDAADTCLIQVTVSGMAGDTADIIKQTESSFSGFLVC